MDSSDAMIPLDLFFTLTNEVELIHDILQKNKFTVFSSKLPL